MKCIPILSILLLAAPPAVGQPATASLAGAVLDAKTQKPVPAALVMAVQNGLPPFTRNTKSGADGAFLIQNLPAGKYSLCVQAPGDAYLDPCQWIGSPTTVTLVSGQAATGISLKLTAASVVHIQVQDAQGTLDQKTKDGRRPDLTVGVWGPKGLYYPARAVPRPTAVGQPRDPFLYQLAIPRDTGLKFHIASRDVKLGNAVGVALAGNASQEAFQHATGDRNPKSFAFTVLGLLP